MTKLKRGFSDPVFEKGGESEYDREFHRDRAAVPDAADTRRMPLSGLSAEVRGPPEGGDRA